MLLEERTNQELHHITCKSRFDPQEFFCRKNTSGSKRDLQDYVLRVISEVVSMRYNADRAYDERIYDPKVIEEHLVPEFQYREFVNNIAKKQGTLTGFYWIIDLVAKLYESEFPEERVHALKRLTLKVFTIYDEKPLKHTLCTLLKRQGFSAIEIAKQIQVSRAAVYYFLKRELVLPTQCMLTYGEYDLMMDFMDCWNNLQSASKL